MFSEFNVRADVSHVEALDARPLRKARMLLRIARKVRAAASRLGILSRHHYGIEDPLGGARFQEASNRLFTLYIEVRAHARAALRTASEPLGYGYAPRERAYPSWSVSDDPKIGGFSA